MIYSLFVLCFYAMLPVIGITHVQAMTAQEVAAGNKGETPLPPLAYITSPDGSKVLAASPDGSKVLAASPDGSKVLAASPDGSKVLAGAPQVQVLKAATVAASLSAENQYKQMKELFSCTPEALKSLEQYKDPEKLATLGPEKQALYKRLIEDLKI